MLQWKWELIDSFHVVLYETVTYPMIYCMFKVELVGCRFGLLFLPIDWRSISCMWLFSSYVTGKICLPMLGVNHQLLQSFAYLLWLRVFCYFNSSSIANRAESIRIWQKLQFRWISLELLNIERSMSSVIIIIICWR